MKSPDTKYKKCIDVHPEGLNKCYVDEIKDSLKLVTCVNFKLGKLNYGCKYDIIENDTHTCSLHVRTNKK